MLITRGFVYVHVPKTGGTFVRKITTDTSNADFIVEHAINGHAGVNEIPTEWRHLPRLSSVRNPWDWYVSWYEYQKLLANRTDTDDQTAQNPPFWSHISANNTLGFEDTLLNLLNANLGEIDEPYHQKIRTTMRERDVGLFTAYFRRMGIARGASPNHGEIFVAKMEKLREDFYFFLKINRILVTIDLVNAIWAAPPENQTQHRAYGTYYSPHLANLVAFKEREIIKDYDYSFVSGPHS